MGNDFVQKIERNKKIRGLWSALSPERMKQNVSQTQ
jgi:hypothetical protein